MMFKVYVNQTDGSISAHEFQDLYGFREFIRSDVCKRFGFGHISYKPEECRYVVVLGRYSGGMITTPGYQRRCEDDSNGVQMYFASRGFARRPVMMDIPGIGRDLEVITDAMSRLERILSIDRTFPARVYGKPALESLEMYLTWDTWKR